MIDLLEKQVFLCSLGTSHAKFSTDIINVVLKTLYKN